jgi:hypothetical protein
MGEGAGALRCNAAALALDDVQASQALEPGCRFAERTIGRRAYRSSAPVRYVALAFVVENATASLARAGDAGDRTGW